MKLLTVVIPCYNSAEYMCHAIDTALTGGDDVEILIVDDGSADNTFAIAQKYREKYPTIVRAIRQENGGHGAAVNTGIDNATGLFFKVLDSDDWFDAYSLKRVLQFIRSMSDEVLLDMIISNYVYEKPSADKRRVVTYRSAVPPERFCTWDDIKFFKITQNLLMHSIIYRTELLRECHLRLPKHSFYVDNIFAFSPLPYVRHFYYLNVNLYHYYIGRDDQSVNEDVMTRQIDQQIRVTRIMIDSYSSMTVTNKKLNNYMMQYLAVMMIVCSALLVNEGSKESLTKREVLWRYLKKTDPHVYHVIMQRKWGFALRSRNIVGKKVIICGYHICNRVLCFS